MKDMIKIILAGLVVLVLSGGAFYACEIRPMEECMDGGHSFTYCHKLLNK